MTESETTYGLLLSFKGLYPTMPEDNAFCHGVEFGEILHRMRSGTEAEIKKTTYAANRTVVERAAASQGWEVEFLPSGVEGWDFTKLTKVKAERANPHGLRVVKPPAPAEPKAERLGD
jgi:hypothetical protein